MGNGVLQDQSAERMAQQDATVKFLARCAGRQRQFADGCQNAVLRGNFSAGGFAAPEGQKFSDWESQVFAAPGHVYANDIYLSFRDFGVARKGIDKVLEPADVT